jgi:hypothetical protein
MSVLRRLPKHALLVDFPAEVQADVIRILDAEARRLADERDLDAASALAGGDLRSLDGCGDKPAPCIQ